MGNPSTGTVAVDAFVKALASAFALADTDEKKRELKILSQFVYLQLHAVADRLSEHFMEGMKAATEKAQADREAAGL